MCNNMSHNCVNFSEVNIKQFVDCLTNCNCNIIWLTIFTITIMADTGFNTAMY